MPWILNEAGALKAKVGGLKVIDASSPSPGRDVNVWFRNPEVELRDMTFPSIVLEFSNIDKASDREHRGVTTLPYIPEQFYTDGTAPSVDETTGVPLTWDTTQDFDVNLSPFKVQEFPIPYNIDFKVTLYSRFETQLFPLIADLAAIDRLPSRFGYLEIPQDGTVRTMDLLAGPEIESARDAEGKRIFRAVYAVRVVSELNLYDVEQITKRITAVDLDLKVITAT